MLRPDELIVDNFAGGGGASVGIEWGLGRAVDIAINHDAEAIAMHLANHPGTRHFCEDVWDVDPVAATAGRPVGLAWFSPDCKHFSKAKGGKPVEKRIRGLAWVVARWAKAVRPRVIILENVEEFQTWGPLIPLIDAHGRTEPDAQGKPKMVPCPARKGLTFRRWWKQLENLGYRVDARELRACDYGAPTIRKRLFVIARCDDRPIVWPRPTHGPGLTPHRTAAHCIDWTLRCASIFERARPLAEATLRRIAKGIKRFVIDAAEPFIVTCNHQGEGFRGQGLTGPFKTLTSARDAHGLVVPKVTKLPADRIGHHLALVAAFLAKHLGHEAPVVPDAGADAIRREDQYHDAETSNLVKLYGTCNHGQSVREPMATVTGEGNHIAEVRAFLIKFYGDGGQWASVAEPMHTLPTKDRMGLVTLHGEEYAIADIGMRMLQPRELYRAQGFPDTYTIDPVVNGKPLPKASQVRMCGNSVCPPIAQALAAANLGQEYVDDWHNITSPEPIYQRSLAL